MKSEILFPNIIWNQTLSDIDNNLLKEFAYKLKDNQAGKVISNYGGWHSQDLMTGQCDHLDKLAKIIDYNANNCAKEVGIEGIVLHNIWININPPGSYNTLHHHLGAIFSGVYYIDANPLQGNIYFERSDNAEYHLPIDSLNKTSYTTTRVTYPSTTNCLYIFPGWLKHSVEGNRSNKDRISISFNYGEKK
tara:strand:- start:197 stop:769 length:573 start_codon:yes stop_codon:yes gene_type:complete